MGSRRIASQGTASSCYFRTSTIAPERKALVQVTERCNLHCAHCFVSAGPQGSDIPLEQMKTAVLPQLREARVTRLTITGGEPFAHPDVIGIVSAARALEMTVTICTNATLIEHDALDELALLGHVKLNVSLDGFSTGSHGKFRGAPASFALTKRTIEAISTRGLLKGVLVTPNNLATLDEYDELCRFARACGAEYVLMNPLSSMGRGVHGVHRLGAAEPFMRALADRTTAFEDEIDIVRIRFPNDDRPLSGCEAGTIIYVFATGDVTVCPYLVFAARTPNSQHRDSEFIVGNVFADHDIASRLDRYRLHDRTELATDPVCDTCVLADGCGRGCPAAVIASGGRLGDRDREQCPIPDPAEDAA
jgi:radical SAM protein with 4Fe4S-binding SPASM domain